MSALPPPTSTGPAVPATPSRRLLRAALVGVAGVALAGAGVGTGAAGSYGSSTSAGTPTAQPAVTPTAAQADKAAQSDVRGAIAAVEHYYAENGRYPFRSLAGDNSKGATPQVDLGGVTPDIALSDGTRLYYAPYLATGSYRICATNAAGTGQWYLYDASRGGSVMPVSRTTGPGSCC